MLLKIKNKKRQTLCVCVCVFTQFSNCFHRTILCVLHECMSLKGVERKEDVWIDHRLAHVSPQAGSYIVHNRRVLIWMFCYIYNPLNFYPNMLKAMQDNNTKHIPVWIWYRQLFVVFRVLTIWKYWLTCPSVTRLPLVKDTNGIAIHYDQSCTTVWINIQRSPNKNEHLETKKIQNPRIPMNSK